MLTKALLPVSPEKWRGTREGDPPGQKQLLEGTGLEGAGEETGPGEVLVNGRIRTWIRDPNLESHFHLSGPE